MSREWGERSSDQKCEKTGCVYVNIENLFETTQGAKWGHWTKGVEYVEGMNSVNTSKLVRVSY